MKLLPFRQINDNDIINQFALEGTGEAGLFVAVSAGDFDKAHGWDFTKANGATFNGVTAPLYVTQTRVRPVASGDNKYNTIGITLWNVAIYDENGEKYAYHKQKAIENQVIESGKTMPILTKGLVTLGSGAYIGTPAVGKVIIPSNTVAGAVDVVTYASVTEKAQILGKVIGTSAKHGGQALVYFNTAA